MARWPCAEMGSLVLHKAVFLIILIVIYIYYIFMYMCFYACAGVLCMACEREMFLSFIYKRNIDERNRCKTEMVFNPK
jgi:hypothetical protein